MSRKTMYILIGVIVVMVFFLIVGVVGLFIIRQNTPKDDLITNSISNLTNQTTETNTTTNTNTTGNTDNDNTDNSDSSAVKTKIFENDYMKFTYPETWTINESSPSAINIENGHYILFINTQATQASGVTGGRFSEIAMGAPGADLVIKTHPASPCGTHEVSDSFSGYQSQTRTDLYISNAETSENCNLPSNGKNLWYFAYVANEENHYFNYYIEGQPKAYVITMTYNTNSIENLPAKGSPELTNMLDQMTGIVRTLEINSNNI